jgi:hypothetical protein
MDENYSVILGHGKFILISKLTSFFLDEKRKRKKEVKLPDFYTEFSVFS